MTSVRPIKARITNAGGSAPTRVDVYDDIGEGGWFAEGLTAKSFANQLSGVTGPLEVHINSGGGDVWDGISIKNAIEAHKGPVTTVVDGIAASIASVIAQAGTDRVMMPGSMMMIHEASTVAAGNAADFAKTAAILDDVSANLASLYARSAGGTADQWRAAMKDETWYSADQAVAAGLADRTGDGTAALPAGLDLDQFAAAMPGQIAAQLRTLPRVRADDAGSTPFEPDEHEDSDDDPVTCPSCDSGNDGDARFCDQCGAKLIGRDDVAPVEDSGRRVVVVRRLLGAETMPITDKALPVHHTAVVDKPWDGPAAVAAMPNDDTVLEYCHAWQSDTAAATPHKDGDDDADDQKANYKFPHHETKGGPAFLAACHNGLARLAGADIPDADRPGVEAHLRAHMADDAKGDDNATHDHAGFPGWLHNAAAHPAWLNDAEEAK